MALVLLSTPEQEERGRDHAQKMQDEAQRLKRTEKGGAAVGVQMDTARAITAEIVLAEAKGWPWTGGYQKDADLSQWRPDIGTLIDVKLSMGKWFLHIPKRVSGEYPPEARFVMASRESSVYTYWGWVTIAFACTKAYWEPFEGRADRKACWRISVNHLASINTLELT